MALIWVWRYHNAVVDEVDDDSWVRIFWNYDESDECAVSGVEVDGRWIDADEIRKMPEFVELERQAWAQAGEAVERSRTLTHIEVRHPVENDWSLADSVESGEVDAIVAAWAARVGEDRVRVKVASR